MPPSRIHSHRRKVGIDDPERVYGPEPLLAIRHDVGTPRTKVGHDPAVESVALFAVIPRHRLQPGFNQHARRSLAEQGCLDASHLLLDESLDLGCRTLSRAGVHAPILGRVRLQGGPSVLLALAPSKDCCAARVKHAANDQARTLLTS